MLAQSSVAEDQEDRLGFPNTKLTYKEIHIRDEARRNEILGLLKRNEVRIAQDYLYGAVIFHNGQTFEHYRMSASLAWIARYGVESHRDNQKRLVLSNIDETAVSDDERATYNVKPLSQLKANPGRGPIKPLP